MYIYGKNAILEALKDGKFISKVYVLKGKKEVLKDILKRLHKENIKIVESDKQKLKKLVNTDKHQGIVALISPVKPVSLENLFERLVNYKEYKVFPYLVYLDHLEDPHNVGAIFRTAFAFKAAGIVLPKDRSVYINDTVVKVSTGTVFKLPYALVNAPSKFLKEAKKRNIWIVSLESINSVERKLGVTSLRKVKELSETKAPHPLILVVGSESKGVSKSALELSDLIYFISMNKDADSLNVSVATGIALYKIYKDLERET